MSDDKENEPAAGKPEEGEPSQDKALPAAEIGGPAGPEPTRFGDWEKAGRCSDF